MDVRFTRSFDSCWTFCQSAGQYVKGSQSSAPRDTIYLSSNLFQWQDFLFVDRLYGRQCMFLFLT